MRRQHRLDSRPVRCAYASQPTSRPHCQLSAVVRYGPIALCADCDARRSTLGKGITPHRLPPQPPLDVLDWIASADAAVHQAHTELAAAVARARAAAALLGRHRRRPAHQPASRPAALRTRSAPGPPHNEPRRHGSLGGVRQWIESVFDTLKGQLGLEHHGARTAHGVFTRVTQRLLAPAAAVWRNWAINSPDTDKRSLIAYDH